MGCKASKSSCIPKNTKKSKRNNIAPLNTIEEVYSERTATSIGDTVKTESTKKVTISTTEKIILLESAPKSFNGNFPGNNKSGQIKSKKDPKSIVIGSASITKVEDELLVNKDGQEQPVDQAARQLALSNARPATWKDFYWHLFEYKGLKSDEEKMRAIFSWVCSLNSFEPPSDPELREKKINKQAHDSPLALIEAFRQHKITYYQALEIICTACSLECVVVEGIAKGAEFNVNDRELLDNIEETGQPLFDEKEGKIHPLAKVHVHSWNACKIDGKWELFDPIWAARRLTIKNDENNSIDDENSRSARQTFKEALLLQYETDMFYFKTNPRRLLFTHFPFDPKWQLIEPQISLKRFYDTVILKPLFFRYGLSVYSHMDANIITKSELVTKLRLPDQDYENLIFTFNLTLEGLGNIQKSQKLFPFGMHWISGKEKIVTFRFRFPKSGRYRLILYARKKEEKLFADICEYSILADVSENDSIYPFPHDSQTSYGPTEMAKELRVMVTPSGTEALLKSINGIIELKFKNAINGDPNLPLITARLRSVLAKTADLQDCLLFRNIEACRAATGMSDYLQINPKNPVFGYGSGVPLTVVTAYLPRPGEYTLEVFAKSPDAPEDESYRLAWQFMINSELAWHMNDYLREQLRCVNMGPQNHLWEKLGLATLSHVDPLIRIPTHARHKDLNSSHSEKSQKDLLARYASEASTINSSTFGPESSTASQITVMDVNQLESMKNEEFNNENGNPKVTLEGIDENLNKNSFDLRVVITGPPRDVLTVIAQFVDISEDDEKDVTGFLNRLSDEESNNDEELLEDLIQNELNGPDRIERTNSGMRNNQRITYDLRVPTGGHFYKLYLYASPTSMEITESIPLIYTYLIEAPGRITSSEQPYVGSILGAYEKKQIQK